MTRFLVNNKHVSAFSNSAGIYPVVDGAVEIPLGPYAAELLEYGDIRFPPAVASVEPVVESIPDETPEIAEPVKKKKAK